MKSLLTGIMAALSLLATAPAIAQTAPQTAPDVSSVPNAHTASSLPKDWNERASFYEIFVRSYKDSDGDGIGDFNGITQSLDYLQSLGVTGLWLMPMHPSQDKDHGYAVNDYRAVNPEYGTMADFENLVNEAHKRGIGIIIDYVINHAGSGNAIFLDAASSKQSPYRDWFILVDEDPKWPGFSWGPFRKVENGEGYFYGVFDTTMPDWNLDNPKVVAYHEDNFRFWLNKGVDGFRIDAVTMLYEDGPKAFFNNPKNPAMIARMRRVIDSYDNRYLICEASEKPEMYTDACQNAFAFGTQTAIVNSVRSGKLDGALFKQFHNPERDQMPLVLQSHDAYVGDRLANQFGTKDLRDYKLVASISILGSSTPFSYYGEEVGMSNNGNYSDPGLRAPMSWDATPETVGFSTHKPYRAAATNASEMNVAAQAEDYDGLYWHYRKLWNARQAHPALGKGAFKLLSREGASVLVFARSDATETVYVLINLSGDDRRVRLKIGKGKEVTQALIDPRARYAPQEADQNGNVFVTLSGKSTQVLVKSKL